MNKQIENFFSDLESKDDPKRLKALKAVLHATEAKVDWIYDKWDWLINKLNDENSFQRSISIMILCNLAVSDSKKKMSDILKAILSHTKDEKFITSRQTIQNIWKIAVAIPNLKTEIVGHLSKRFKECITEKHYNLIRQDIIQSMKAMDDQAVYAQAMALVEKEQDPKYKKKIIAILNAN